MYIIFIKSPSHSFPTSFSKDPLTSPPQLCVSCCIFNIIQLFRFLQKTSNKFISCPGFRKTVDVQSMSGFPQHVCVPKHHFLCPNVENVTA